jgi:hypothetical protein
MLDAVLVGEGLGAVAELAAAECAGPVALIVPRLDVAAGSPGALAQLGRLRRYALDRTRGRVAPVPAGVVAEVPIASGEELLGVVLLLGDAPAGEDALERLRLVAVAALTEIALARAAEVPDDRASATLLDALAAGATLDREEIVRRAARAGCDLRGGAIAVCCELHVERPRHVAALVRDDWPGALAQHVLGDDALGAPRLHALLPARAGPADGARALAGRLARHGPVGLSPLCEDPAGLGRAMQAAALAVDLRADAGAGPPWSVSVADPVAARRHFEATLGPLVRYDDQYGTELVPTLERVLDAAGDVGEVAADLGVPAHRVRYRMEKVRELSGWDPMAPAHRRALALGARCLQVVAPALPG